MSLSLESLPQGLAMVPRETSPGNGLAGRSGSWIGGQMRQGMDMAADRLSEQFDYNPVSVIPIDSKTSLCEVA
jgi:hypothetical protein